MYKDDLINEPFRKIDIEPIFCDEFSWSNGLPSHINFEEFKNIADCSKNAIYDGITNKERKLLNKNLFEILTKLKEELSLYTSDIKNMSGVELAILFHKFLRLMIFCQEELKKKL